MPRDLRDPDDRWWTVEQAAEHLEVKVKTIRAYIHDGLTVHFPRQGGYVDRDELLAEVRRRAERKRGNAKKSSA
jgi:DNA-binding transcriptional MerR regulator